MRITTPLDPDPAAIRRARKMVGDQLCAWGMSALVDDARVDHQRARHQCDGAMRRSDRTAAGSTAEQHPDQRRGPRPERHPQVTGERGPAGRGPWIVDRRTGLLRLGLQSSRPTANPCGPNYLGTLADSRHVDTARKLRSVAITA